MFSTSIQNPALPASFKTLVRSGQQESPASPASEEATSSDPPSDAQLRREFQQQLNLNRQLYQQNKQLEVANQKKHKKNWYEQQPWYTKIAVGLGVGLVASALTGLIATAVRKSKVFDGLLHHPNDWVRGISRTAGNVFEFLASFELMDMILWFL
jgi:hypothetical protein